jgi:3-hydroxyacyl-[acyl-carrier-protein] dehydratase
MNALGTPLEPPPSTGTLLSKERVLALVPQQEPFRFIDEIVEIDSSHIVSRYRFRPDHDFYRGHFPGNPITPGVILVETMAQTGVVALGLYLLAKEQGEAALSGLVTMFTDFEMEFSGIVRPGDLVRVEAQKVYFRRHKIRSTVKMFLTDGTLVASGSCSGMGVPQ